MYRIPDFLRRLIPLLVAATIFAAYTLTHPYPGLAGGLYLSMADQIQHGYTLPTQIPHYTSGGIPFGYPPLLFYIGGALLDIGVAGLTLARFGGFVAFLLALLAYQEVAKEILDNPNAATIAAVIVATSPPLLVYTIGAGGWVRASGLLFTLIGLFLGLQLFRTHSRRWVAASALFFGLTILTHPNTCYYLQRVISCSGWVKTAQSGD